MLKIDCKKKARFGLFALVLILCVGFSLFAFMSFGANTAGQTKPGETSVPTGSMEATPTPTPTAENQTSDVKPALISEAEALALAMPVIEKYAAENNRTITSITASLNEVQDFEGTRGGHTLEKVTQENTELSSASSSMLFPCFPVWHVEVHFVDINYFNYRTVPLTDNTTCTLAEKTNFPMGLVVSVWADTGALGHIGMFH